MLDQLAQLSDTLGVVTKEQARQIIDAINRRLEDLLRPQMMKVYWKEEARNGGVILRPVAYINKSRDPDPRPFQVQQTGGDIQTWAFSQGSTAWVEDLRNKDRAQPVRNEVTGEAIPPEYLQDVSQNVDSTIIVSLGVRGDLYGVYVLEFDNPMRLRETSEDLKNLLEDLGQYLGRVIWHADTHEYNQRLSTRAISQFLDSIQGFKFPPSLLGKQYKAGFIAHPFEEEHFERVRRVITEILEKKGIQARHYEPHDRGRLIIDDLMDEITNSQFCIADVTGFNPNVMSEVGMMMIRGKKMLIIRRKDNTEPLPFFLNQIDVSPYELQEPDGQLRIWKEADKRYVSFEEVLDSLIANLPQYTDFHAARNWP